MAETIAEKIIARHARRPVTVGELVLVEVDGSMAVDAGAPRVIRIFRRMGGEALWDPSCVSLVIDHAAPAPTREIANLHQLMRDFSAQTGCRLYDVGDGICHQLMIENGHVGPQDLFVGGDSHTCTYGALGAFAVGMGSTDLAAVWLTGKTWLKVPHSFRIVLDGALPEYVSAKDVILHLTGELGLSGANYAVIEFSGSTVVDMTLSGRVTLSNMACETGAKTAWVDTTGLDLPYPFEALQPDPGAGYARETHLDVSSLTPQVGVPHAPDRVLPVEGLVGRKIDHAFIGSCTNSRLEDLHAAAALLRGRRIASGVRLMVTAGSRSVFREAAADGTITILTDAGATFIPSGCGPCAGTHQGIPGDGEVVISTANRNFPGRMGNPNAGLYLASPAVVAAAAVAGEIVHPSSVVAEET